MILEGNSKKIRWQNMNWFIVSHFLLSQTVKKTNLGIFAEDIFRLIGADSETAAIKKMTQIAKEEANFLDTERINNKPAICKFGGISRCYSIAGIPSEDSIIGYNLFKVDSNKKLKRLLQDKEVEVTYLFDLDKSFDLLLEPIRNNYKVGSNQKNAEDFLCAYVLMLILEKNKKKHQAPWFVCEILFLLNDIAEKLPWVPSVYMAKEKLKSIKILNETFLFNGKKVKLTYAGIKSFRIITNGSSNDEPLADKAELAFSIFHSQNEKTAELLLNKEDAKMIYRAHY